MNLKEAKKAYAACLKEFIVAVEFTLPELRDLLRRTNEAHAVYAAARESAA